MAVLHRFYYPDIQTVIDFFETEKYANDFVYVHWDKNVFLRNVFKLFCEKDHLYCRQGMFKSSEHTFQLLLSYQSRLVIEVGSFHNINSI